MRSLFIGAVQLMSICSLASTAAAAAPFQLRAGVFGGGPFYYQADTVLPALQDSGFDSLILWTLHVSEGGDLIFNDVPLVHAGLYVGDPAWPAKIAALKGPKSTVSRIEWCIGSWGVADFEHLQSLAAAGALAPGGILQRNFAALRQTFPVIDAISYDDESNYDTTSTVQLSLLLGTQGWHVSLTPYTASEFWRTVYEQSNAAQPGLIDRVYLQGYAGGSGNDPAQWSALFPGLQVELGLWGKHGPDCRQGDSPKTVTAILSAYKKAGSITGGWLWLLDDLLACRASYPLVDYVNAIKAS